MAKVFKEFVSISVSLIVKLFELPICCKFNRPCLECLTTPSLPKIKAFAAHFQVPNTGDTWIFTANGDDSTQALFSKVSFSDSSSDSDGSEENLDEGGNQHNVEEKDQIDLTIESDQAAGGVDVPATKTEQSNSYHSHHSQVCCLLDGLLDLALVLLDLLYVN